jgi:iron complex transport system substrate-binding protein
MKNALHYLLVVLLLVAGCSKPAKPVRPAAAGGGVPARIVSFSPAITDILFEMGLGDQVVGVTQFCSLPPGVQRPRVGDARAINAEAILTVWPSVIFTQSNPDLFQGVRNIDPDVRIVPISLERLADIPATILRIGKEVGSQDQAARKAAAFTAAIDAVRKSVAGKGRPRVLFVMGTDHPTVAGSGNFIADYLDAAGAANAGADIPGPTRWRTTHVEAIIKAAPDVLVCQASAGQPAEAVRQYWSKWPEIPAVRAGRVFVVTEPQWSIPSTHLAELLPKLAEMIHGPAAGAATQPATRSAVP